MHEAELANMTQRQLVETLSALLLRYEQDSWTIDDAGLIAEVRDELADRDYSTSLWMNSDSHALTECERRTHTALVANRARNRATPPNTLRRVKPQTWA